MNKEKLIDVILTELKVICKENDIDSGYIDGDTMLFGGTALIDSLALVGLIIKVEEYVFENTGKEIQVIDEEAIITDSTTPFRNAVTLSELVLAKLYAG
jgi:hypothetical protein